MKNIIVAALFALVTVALVFAHPRNAPSTAASVAETIKQVEQDWANASVAVDVGKVSQILGDDWRGVGYAGKVHSKESTLSRLQSREFKLDSYEMGPMEVKVLGNIAVVQGSGAATGHSERKGTVVKTAWMDVLEKRGDKWVVVRSQSTKLP